MQSLEYQVYAFIVTMLIGVTIGILFDFYKVVKGAIRHGKIFGYLGNLVFWVVSTLMVFFLLLVSNWGELRLYVLIGVFTGVLAYLKLLSRYIIRILLSAIILIKNIINRLIRVIKFTWWLVTYPIVLFRNIIIVPIGYLGTAWTKACRFTGRIIEYSVTKPVKNAVLSTKKQIAGRLQSLFRKK